MSNIVKLNKNRKRVGRGIAAGQGKTAGRGTKGQNSRSGKKRHNGFTTGATPLHMKLPKIDGNKVVKLYFSFTTDQIAQNFQSNDVITIKALIEKGLLPRRIPLHAVVKIIQGTKKTEPLRLDRAIAHSKNVAVVTSETT